MVAICLLKKEAPAYLSKRLGIYYLWYVDSQGRKKKVSTRTAYKADAPRFLTSFTRDSARPPKKRLKDFVSEFLPFVEATFSESWAFIYRLSLGHLLTVAGDTPLTSLTMHHIDRYKVKRLAEVSPVSVNHQLQALRAAMNTAVRWKLLMANPFAGVRQIKIAEDSPAYFTREQFHRLIGAIKDDWFREIDLFAVQTGLRRGEIVALRWENVDLHHRVIRIKNDPSFKTKTGKVRVITMSDAVRRAPACRTRHEGFVFSYKGRKIRGGHLSLRFHRLIARLGMSPKLNFHSIRHYAESRTMPSSRVDPMSLGHSPRVYSA